MKYTMTIELKAEEPIDRDYLDCIEEDSLIAVQGAIRNITYRDIRPISCKINRGDVNNG